MKKMYMPDFSQDFLDQTKKVQKSYRGKKIKKYLADNAIALCSLLVSFISLVVAIIAVVID